MSKPIFKCPTVRPQCLPPKGVWPRDKFARSKFGRTQCAQGEIQGGISSKRNQQIVSATAASGTGKAMRQDTALEIPAQVPLHETREGVTLRIGFPHPGEPSLQMRLDQLINDCPL
jgi:hypothetical protein